MVRKVVTISPALTGIRAERKCMKEYSVHIISNDGTEEHYLGHYPKLSQAKKHAKTREGYGNRDVYVAEREVTEWIKSKDK